MTHILHIRTTTCRCCGISSSTSELYEVVDQKPNYRHLHRTREHPVFRPDVVQLPAEFVPTCALCVLDLPLAPIAAPVPLGWRAKVAASLLAVGGARTVRRNDPNDLSDIA